MRITTSAVMFLASVLPFALARGNVTVHNRCQADVYLTILSPNHDPFNRTLIKQETWDTSVAGEKGVSWVVTTKSNSFEPNTPKLTWAVNDDPPTFYYSAKIENGSPFSPSTPGTDTAYYGGFLIRPLSKEVCQAIYPDGRNESGVLTCNDEADFEIFTCQSNAGRR